MQLTDEEHAYEQMRFKKLADEARMMTALGLSLEDTREDRTAQFVRIINNMKLTPSEAQAFSKKHWNYFKKTGYLRPDC